MWIKAEHVGTLLQRDLSGDTFIDGLIAQCQALAVGEVGAHDDLDSEAAPEDLHPLQATLAAIVARRWQAGQSAQVNPAAHQSDTTGPFTFQDPNAGAAGLALTDREKKDLRKAAGKPGVWIQPTTRGDRLETAPVHDELEDETDPIDKLAAAQEDLGR